MNRINNQICFCGKVHAKIFEIILIVGFTFGDIVLAINFVLNMWFFKQSYYILYIEIGLLALNFFSIIFSIILRVFRSNGSVLNDKYTCSHCISIIILFLVIINFLGSLGEDALFYFVFSYIKFIEGDHHDGISDSQQKILEIFGKIMNNPDEEEDRRNLSDDNDAEKEKRKMNILKILPWLSFSLNAFIQILALVFIILLIKRIKHKSDYGIALGILTQNGQGSSIQNQMATNRNSGIGLADNNIYKGKKTKAKTNKKKSKQKKAAKSPRNNMISSPESDQVEINKKGKRNKKGKKKKNKNKDKAKK